LSTTCNTAIKAASAAFFVARATRRNPLAGLAKVWSEIAEDREDTGFCQTTFALLPDPKIPP
jgi:hypothetical protein